MSSEELNELLRIVTATPATIRTLLANVSDEQLRRRDATGNFSLVENVCHLRDIETEGYLPRISRILKEDQPFLGDIDGGRLATEREYNKQDVHAALHDFAEARSETTRVLSNLSAEELSSEGTLEGVGKVQLADLLLMMKDHDAIHLADIEHLLQSDKL